MRIRPLSRAGGAEISGVDLSKPLDAASIAAIRDAFDEFAVLVFPDQHIDEADQLRFCNAMGGATVRGRFDQETGAAQDGYGGNVHLVTNLTKDGVPLGSFGDGEVWFHHDGSFKEKPYAATVLYGVAVTSTGGETVFANMHMAYDRLPDTMKKRLEGLAALNIYRHGNQTEQVNPDGDISDAVHWVHPVAVRHPRTGRKALYVSPLITVRIEGLPQEESDGLLEALFRFVDDESITFEHHWSVGDLLMMDNISTTHARRDFQAGEPRLLRRTVVEGVAIGP